MCLVRIWDVDISDTDAQTLWTEFKPYLKTERQAYYNAERGIVRDAERFGFEITDIGSAEEFEEPFAVGDCLERFLTIRLGNRAFFDEDTFVESVYFQKFGKDFSFENLNISSGTM